MSERRNSVMAQNQAADALLLACSRPQTFRQAVNGAAAAPLPDEFLGLIHVIDQVDPKNRRKRHGRSH